MLLLKILNYENSHISGKLQSDKPKFDCGFALEFSGFPEESDLNGYWTLAMEPDKERALNLKS